MPILFVVNTCSSPAIQLQSFKGNLTYNGFRPQLNSLMGFPLYSSTRTKAIQTACWLSDTYKECAVMPSGCHPPATKERGHRATHSKSKPDKLCMHTERGFNSYNKGNTSAEVCTSTETRWLITQCSEKSEQRNCSIRKGI